MKISIIYIGLFLFTSAYISGCGYWKNNNSAKQNIVTNSDTAIAINTTDNNNSSENSTNISMSSSDDGFIFIYATSQKWHGGVKGSGSGVNYEVCLLSQLSSSQLVIDELWIDQTYHETSASRKFPKTSSEGYNTGDTIYLYANDYNKSPDDIRQFETVDGQKEVVETKQNIAPPYKYIGDALIGYKINGSRKYKEISKITVKPDLFYP